MGKGIQGDSRYRGPESVNVSVEGPMESKKAENATRAADPRTVAHGTISTAWRAPSNQDCVENADSSFGRSFDKPGFEGVRDRRR